MSEQTNMRAASQEVQAQTPQETGHDKTLEQRVLQVGSKTLQRTRPLDGFDVYVAGLHCGKQDTQMHMEAHHYCKLVNGEFLQCIIFDDNTPDANLIGIEYIISERLYATLPDEERQYWHPHNFEVFSGQLIAPGLPAVAEHELMRQLVNSYGKTWHTWHTGRHANQPGTALPLGEPLLMWSFNREGEADPVVEQAFIERMQFDKQQNRERRQDLTQYAHPQYGVNLLRNAFPQATPTPPPGVRDVEEAPPSDASFAGNPSGSSTS